MVTSVSGSTSTSQNNIGSSIVNSITGGNIDIQSLAENLTLAEKAPKQAILDTRKQAADARISSIGKITSAANDFQSALAALGDPRAIGLTPTSSDTNKADFSYTSYVVPKPVNFSFVVKQLATENTVSLPPINSRDALIGTDGADQGTLTIRRADGTIIDAITFSGTQNLTDLAAIINSNASTNKTGISATILNGIANSDGSYSQNLIISNGTGTANNFNLELSFKQGGTNFTSNSTGLKLNENAIFNGSSGQDAVIATGSYIDPITRQVAFQNTFNSASNTFSNLISGVNINVHQTTTDTNPVTLASATNFQGLANALQTLVDGFNSLLTIVKTEVKYDQDATKRGGLATNSIGKTFISQLRQLTTKAFPDGTGNTYTLADLGVKTNTTDGTLSIDMNVVSQVEQRRPEVLIGVLSSKNATQADGSVWRGPTGAIEQMIALNKIVVGTGSDFSNLLDKTKNSEETAIADAQTKLDTEMVALKNRYLSQFTAMQNILNATKSDQSSLTNMMSSWTAGLKGS